MVQHGDAYKREHGDGSGRNGGTGAGPGSAGGGLARTVQLLAGTYQLTVNPVDGSEMETRPPGESPGRPAKQAPDERPAPGRAATPAGATPWATRPLPVLEREAECDELMRLLSHGRSIRLTGPRGSGRSTLLDAVADRAGEVAPDGLVRLSGYRRSPGDLLYELFAAVHEAPLRRPGPEELASGLETVGAVVLVDDLEFGGAALDRLLSALPECALLLSATPEIAGPSPDAQVEEVFLSGISRTAGLELLEHAVRRPLSHAEADRAADLCSGMEGLPLRFVQAGAVLRRGGELPAAPEEGLAGLVADGLAEPARETLRYALALDGEVPHHTHLPALVGDPHADDAVAELAGAGLVTATDGHYRLAAGVAGELASAGYAEGADRRALAAARHYAWWAGHPSVPPERVGAESAAVLAAVEGAQRAGQPNEAVLLAHTAAPVLAAALCWGAWQRVLRCGQEAADAAGEIAEEAYFHHELGVLALCEGELERARTELEAALGLRGMLMDQRGSVAGRRALALVTDRLTADRAGTALDAGVVGATGPSASSGPRVSQAYAATMSAEESESPPGGVPAAVSAAPGMYAKRPEPSAPEVRLGTGTPRGSAARGTRRNIAAAGAGALLAAVLGTVVTLGSISDSDDAPAQRVKPKQSASQQDGDKDLTADRRDGNGSGGSTGPAAGSGANTLTGSTSPRGTSDGGDRKGSGTPSGSATPSDPASKSPGRSESARPSRPGGTTGGSGSGGGSGTGGTATGGTATGGTTTGGTSGATSGGSTTGGTGGTTGGTTTTGGTATGGTTTGGTTTGGTTGTTGGGTTGTTGGTVTGGTGGSATTGTTTGSTTKGATTGGTTAGSTTKGTTTGGSTTTGSASEPAQIVVSVPGIPPA